MTKSKLSDLKGGVIVGDEGEEEIVTMLADGTSKAGWMVSNSSGQAVGTNTTSPDVFTGIQLERYDTDMDSAPTANDPVRVVRPKSGHKYRVKVTDLNASDDGIPLNFGATAGALSVVAAIESQHVARTVKYTDGDTVAEIVWA